MSLTRRSSTLGRSARSNAFWNGPDEVAQLKAEPSQEDLATAQGRIRDLIFARTSKGDDRFANEARFLFSLQKSDQSLPGYATLDFSYIRDIGRVVRSIERYAKDASVTRPLNLALIAGPGEGKSYFVECVSRKLKVAVEAILFNMASMRDADDLASALDSARNVTVSGRVPLLFLDEFDSDSRNYSLLLPLLWDGEMALGARRLTLGRAVIVLSGSNTDLPSALDDAADMDEQGTVGQASETKLVDLISRVNGGVIRIPRLAGEHRQTDKVCIAVALLRRRFSTGSPAGQERPAGGEDPGFTGEPGEDAARGKDPGLLRAPASFLRFVYNARFRYSVRSLDHLIGVVTRISAQDDRGAIENGILRPEVLNRVLGDGDEYKNSGLIYHLMNDQGIAGVQELWKQCQEHDHYVPVWAKTFDDLNPPVAWTKQSAGQLAYQLDHELRGEVATTGPIDMTSYAGIEPLHITQLWLDAENGQWVHGNKNLRHVFFNLNTLRRLFEEFVSGDPDAQLKVGREMGEAFGTDFVGFLGEIGEAEPDMPKLIGNWCKFDVSGGWGLWSASPNETGESGNVSIRNSFFSGMATKGVGDHSCRYCSVEQGYIEGVLEQLARAAFVEEPRASVTRKQCGVENAGKDPRSACCSFEFAIRQAEAEESAN